MQTFVCRCAPLPMAFVRSVESAASPQPMSVVFLRKDRIPNKKDDEQARRRCRKGKERLEKEKCKTNLIFTGKNSRGFRY